MGNLWQNMIIKHNAPCPLYAALYLINCLRLGHWSSTFFIPQSQWSMSPGTHHQSHSPPRTQSSLPLPAPFPLILFSLLQSCEVAAWACLCLAGQGSKKRLHRILSSTVLSFDREVPLLDWIWVFLSTGFERLLWSPSSNEVSLVSTHRLKNAIGQCGFFLDLWPAASPHPLPSYVEGGAKLWKFCGMFW